MKTLPNGTLSLDAPIPISAAATAIGAKYWQLQRLAKAGRIPVYRPYNSRPLVKLSEVIAYIDSCRVGGGGDEH